MDCELWREKKIRIKVYFWKIDWKCINQNKKKYSIYLYVIIILTNFIYRVNEMCVCHLCILVYRIAHIIIIIKSKTYFIRKKTSFLYISLSRQFFVKRVLILLQINNIDKPNKCWKTGQPQDLFSGYMPL